MVDAAVSYAVQKLGDFLIQKVVLRQSIREDVEWMRNELSYMKSFLKDAEQKQSLDHLVQQWVSEITDLAHEIVDIGNEFSIRVGSGEATQHGIVDRVKRYACVCKTEVNVYRIGNKIESLKRNVLDLSRKRETYGISSISNIEGEGTSSGGPINRTNMKELRRTTSYVEEEHFVGFEDVRNMLLKELLKDEDRRSVISIYGMGGLGKTTLVRKLYNSIDVQKRFACRAWVCVSQEYSTKDLLRTIIKSYKRGCNREELEMIEKMNEEYLERYLREFLNEKRYLVVVDDVWRKEAWESLKRAFSDRHNGSRVVITTRIKEVAERVDSRSFVHHLRFLSSKESWDLFEKKISGSGDESQWFSPTMQGIGKEMVEKCGGLPLAIVVLGGLLSHKKDQEKWHKVKEQLWQHMKKDSIDISYLLSLSYDDLSGELKQCFLYVGIFPEDYVIRVEKLMWLWMAEGFIPQENIMEDIAEEYLYELINRSLIQVAHRSWEKITKCKIHDLLRDLAVEKAKEVKLFDIYDPRVYASGHLGRRHVIHTQVEKFFAVGVPSGKLWSLVFFNPDLEHLDIRNLTIICKRFKYLWVLDLKNVPFGNSFEDCRLPNAIGDLIHLKFLGLGHNNSTRLPSAMGNLKSLQSLEIFSNIPYRVHMEISKLINLRHLVLFNSIGPLKINSPTNLRTLQGVSFEQWMYIDTTNLVNLRELSVSRVNPIEDMAYSLTAISNLKSLTTLTLDSSMISDQYLPSLEPLFSCPCLLILCLGGKIEKLPPFNEMPQSLTMLKLTNSQLSEDPMPTLEKLLSLRSLELDDAYVGEEITCINNGFLQLEHFNLCNLINLETWRLTETTMPVIKSLKIFKCPKLKTIPERFNTIQHLSIE